MDITNDIINYIFTLSDFVSRHQMKRDIIWFGEHIRPEGEILERRIVEMKLSSDDHIKDKVKFLLEINEKAYQKIEKTFEEIKRRNSIGEVSRNDHTLKIKCINIIRELRRVKALLKYYFDDTDIKTEQSEENKCEKLANDFRQPSENIETDKRIVKGVRNFAKHLGIGTTKASKLAKKEILPKDVQYRVGNGWYFNAEKLDKYLKENPKTFSNVRE